MVDAGDTSCWLTQQESSQTEPDDPLVPCPQFCNAELTDTITYTQVSGIIAGQLFIGLFADKLGRKLGSVMTASIMFICKWWF